MRIGEKSITEGPEPSRVVREPARPLIAPSVNANIESLAVAGSWGWFPALVVVAAVGLIVVAQAMRLAPAQSPLATTLFWAGLLLVYAPGAYRAALPQVSRRERIALAVFLGGALYLVKILRAPDGFIFHDEFPHFATANDILRTGALFSANSLQEVSAFFPGLELVTAALASAAHLSVEASGVIVVGAARLLAALGIYLLYEEISGSPRVASIGSVLAITYPNYTFWSSQFSYESLALPLSIFTLVVALWSGRRRTPNVGLLAVALLLVSAVIVTHHVTSYFLAASLILIFAVSLIQPRLVEIGEKLAGRTPQALRRVMPLTLWRLPSNRATAPRVWGQLAAAALVGGALWLLTSGRAVLGYLSPHLQAAARGFLGIVTRSSGTRAPFTSGASAGQPTAASWEQIVAFAAVLLILAALPFGLLQVWRRYRGHGLAVAFGIAALAYPVTLVLRLAGGGAEIANRSWDFLFVALGFVLAAGVAELWMARGHIYRRAGAFAAYASILYVGALIVGTPAWARLPGPFLVGGDTRGLQDQSYAMTAWVRDRLGPDHRFIADYTNKWLLGSLGEQYIVDGLSWVYLSPKLDAQAEIADLIARRVDYVVVDMRLTEQTPRIGHYFEPGEPESPHARPLESERLLKFDREPCLSRIYDSGPIIIYAVEPACAAGGKGAP